MKKLLFWIGSVVLLLVAVDIAMGYAMKWYKGKYHLKGDYRSVDYILNNDDDELVVLGSSVALNSINTKTLQDSLAVKSFNAASNGQGLSYHQTLLEIIATRSKLKTIILGLTEGNMEGSGVGSRYNFLSPYYGCGYDGLDQRLESGGLINKLLMKFSMYQYNKAWFRILLYHFYEPGVKGERGFIAKDIPSLYPSMLDLENDIMPSHERSVQLDSIVALCKRNDIMLIVCIPPKFENYSMKTSVATELENRANKGEFDLWYDAQMPIFTCDSTLFYDNDHLNYKGAEVYTGIVVERLKSVFEKN